MSKNNPHPGYQRAGSELRGLAKQASDAVGVFTRWAAYMEINPDHAISQMQKVLGSDPEKVNPRLREAATNVLQMVQPEALQQVEERKRKRQEERARSDRIHARAHELEQEGEPWSKAWDIAYGEIKRGKRRKRAKPERDGNVVAVNFGRGTS